MILYYTSNFIIDKVVEILHKRISVAEVPRLREFSSVAEVAETSGSPNVAEFAKIRDFGYMNPTTFSRGEFLTVDIILTTVLIFDIIIS